MQNKLVYSVLALLIGLSISLGAFARARGQGQPQAQGRGQSTAAARKAPPNLPGKFTFVPKAEVEALMDGGTGGTRDTPARVVTIGDTYNLGAFVLHYEPRKATEAGSVNSFYHSEIAEVYYVLRGAGTALIGGELDGATWDDSNSASIRQVRGPSVNGAMKNPTTQKWSAGDIIIVPPGVPHTIGYEVTEKTDIIRTVVDPKKSLDLK